MSNLVHVADRVLNRPLMIMPEKLAVITEVLAGRIGIDASRLGPTPDASRFTGSSVDEDPLTGRRAAIPYKRTEAGVAVITIAGSLVNRGAWVGASSGLVSYEGIKFQVAQAVADPKVTSIVLDLESPGGEAVGAFEAADAVRAAAAIKPVTAVVNGMAASAGYALASAASRIVATPTGIAGSIGVVMMHADYSRMLDREGVTPTMIFAGAHKVDGNPYAPLPAGVRSDLQAEVDRFYGLFVDTVAAGRKRLTAKAIRATEARTFMGADAVSAGLADDVGTFEDILLSSTKPSGRAAQRKATMDTTTFTQADLDKARAEGHAVGHAAGLQAGTAEGLKAGADGERGRIKSILGSEEAKGREASAQHLALSTGMSADDAKGALAGITKDAATASLEARTANVGVVVVEPAAQAGSPGVKPSATSAAPAQKGAASWGDIVASITPKKRG